MLKKLIIRDTTMDDIPLLRALHTQSWRDTYPNEDHGVSKEWVEERTALWLTPEGIAKSKEHFKDIIGKDEHFHKVAVVDGIIVGMIHGSRKEGVQHIEALYVDKEYHGRGVAKQLMEKALAWFDPKLPVNLEVVTYNERAKNFYKKFGFLEVPGSESIFAGILPDIRMTKEPSRNMKKGE